MDGRKFVINITDSIQRDEIFKFKFFITFDDLEKRPKIQTIKFNNKLICKNSELSESQSDHNSGNNTTINRKPEQRV